jgi:WD40 repeat protein
MTCAAWSPDGETVYCGDDQGRVSAWRSSDGSLRCDGWLRYATTWAAKPIECVAVSHDGHLLAAGGRATSLGLWESAGLTRRWFAQVQDDKKLGLFDDDRVVDVAFDTTAETLVATTDSWGTASAWTVADGHRRWDYDFQGGNEVKLYVAFDPRGERIATWGLGMFGTAKVFAATSGAVRSNLESRHVLGGRGSAGWSSDGRFFIARTASGVDIMDGATLELQGTVVP